MTCWFLKYVLKTCDELILPKKNCEAFSRTNTLAAIVRASRIIKPSEGPGHRNI